MITLTNLLDLLAAHPDYEQAACFARDFGLVPAPDGCVLRDDADVYLYEVPLTKGNLLDDVAQVAVWRRLGIVVAWCRTESHPGCLVDEQRNPLHITGGPLVAARCAEANLATSMVPEGSFALLRRPPDRNLPMLLSDGKWSVYDTSDERRVRLSCLKRLLWADVPPQKPSVPVKELVITKDELLAGIAQRERETGQPVLTPEERTRSESYSLIVERHRRIAEAVRWNPSLMPQVDKMLIDGMGLVDAAVPIPVLDEDAKGRTLCGVQACAHQSRHVCWLDGKPGRHVGEAGHSISCEDFKVGPKATPATEEHSPTPWRVGVVDLSDEEGTSAAIFDVNGTSVLVSPEVVELGGAPPSADAVLAVEAVNRMAKMDEAAKIQGIAEAARPLPMGAGYEAIRRALDLLGTPGTGPAEDVMRKALDEIAGLPHDEECNTQMAGREDRGCSCHVDVAEKALAAAEHVAKERAEEKPSEHVAVVRPDQPGTVHFVPPLTDARGDVIDRLDFEHRPDGTLRLTVMARKLVGPRLAVRVDPALVERYRKAAAELVKESARYVRDGDSVDEKFIAEAEITAKELADAVLDALGGGGTGR